MNILKSHFLDHTSFKKERKNNAMQMLYCNYTIRKNKRNKTPVSLCLGGIDPYVQGSVLFNLLII